MPCQPSKARRLLKDGKAKVVRRTPFTVQLTIATGETVQPITLGVDSGYVHIGLSAVSEKEELLAADVELRSDMVKLHSERRAYRKNRRFRKTRYRASRFLNRRKPDGWLAPSIQHKLDSHIKLIDSAKNILPVTDIVVEVRPLTFRRSKIRTSRGYSINKVNRLVFGIQGNTCFIGTDTNASIARANPKIPC